MTEPAATTFRYFIAYFWRTGANWGFHRATVDNVRPFESHDDVQFIEAEIKKNYLIGTEITLLNFQPMGAITNVN